MKLRYLFFAAAASTLAAACSEVDELASNALGEKKLETIQSGTDRFATRVSLDSKWEQGDAIGVYMLDAETDNIRNSAMNIQYNADLQETSATTNFVADDGGIGIYDQPCYFMAYYPYSSADAGKVDAGAGIYNVDIADQSAGISAHDLMWASTGDMSTGDLLSKGLSLTFHHQLALLYVNINNDDVKVESVKVNGLNSTARFDLLKGELAIEDMPQAITLHKLSDKSFVGVMLPAGSLAQVMSVTIDANGERFQYMVPSTSKVTKFDPGYEYTFNINLKDMSGNLVSGGNGSTEGWKPGEGEDGDATETNPAIPSGYATVPVNEATDLTAVLNNASGKIALLFAADASYSFSENLVVPAKVTELMLLGDGEEQVEVAMKSIINTGLQRLALNNLKITGDKNTSLLSNAADDNLANQFAADAVIEVKKCELSGMKHLCNWNGNTEYDADRNALASFIVDDCYMHDMTAVFEEYRSKELVLTNSTFYKMSGQAIHPHTYGTAPNPTIIVQHCTLVSLDKTPIQGTSNGCVITYENNVSALIDPSHDNLSYNTTASTGEGNSAAKNDGTDVVATGGFKNVNFNTDYQMSELMQDAANGDFTLLIDAKVGDPRWYKSVE